MFQTDPPKVIVKRRRNYEVRRSSGTWKVAYADFVTAMMSFFMVMWILGLSDDDKLTISGYFNDPLGYSKTEPFTRNIVRSPGLPVTQGQVEDPKVDIVRRQRRDIVLVGKRLSEAMGIRDNIGNPNLINSGPTQELLKNVQVSEDRDGLRVEFRESAEAVFFETGSASLREPAKELIAKVAAALKKENRTMYIEGHTDSMPYSDTSQYDNWDLSQDRANALRRELERDGIPSRLILGVNGFADRRLKLPQDPKNPANRRVSILLPVAQI